MRGIVLLKMPHGRQNSCAPFDFGSACGDATNALPSGKANVNRKYAEKKAEAAR
jgi:hypothetical protein